MPVDRVAVVYDASDFSRGKSVKIDGVEVPGQILDIDLETYQGGIEVKVTTVFHVQQVESV